MYTAAVGILLAVALLVCPWLTHAQQIDIDAVRAREEFRWGVKAFHGGLFSDSILSFEQSLSLKPEDPETLQWLGRAYYRSGFEDTALRIWADLISAGEASAYLQNLYETVSYRRGVHRELEPPERFVISYDLPGTQSDFTIFQRPASIFPRGDASFFVTSFAGNQVILFSANGAVKRRVLGGLQGLDHPFDVLETSSGMLFITEFSRNTIYRGGLSGINALRFGSAGGGPGELIGPQYLADDGAGYIYVTEAGNRRVSKFDYDGNFVLSFGARTDDFAGFQSPTGVAVVDDRVYVADSRGRYIALFDRSGNYITTIEGTELVSPEGLSATPSGGLLVADGPRILRFDPAAETLEFVSDLEGEAIRMGKAVEDVNGNVIAVDFTRNSVTWLSRASALYTGMFPEIRAIASRDHPEIGLEISVQNRQGDAYIGLDSSNFVVTERRLPVTRATLINPEGADRAAIALLVEGSPLAAGAADAIRSAVGDIYGALGTKGAVQLFIAGENASMITKVGASLSEVESLAASPVDSTEDWRFDRGLRSAASSLVNRVGKRTVVFLSTGELAEGAFRDFSLDVLARFLANNDISFYCVYLQDGADFAEELEYLSNETGGTSLYVYQPSGVAPLVSRILAAPTGRYYFTYESGNETDFGNAFIPVETEAYLFKRSGRAESGYFPPLEY